VIVPSKMDPMVAEAVDYACSQPIKFRLKHDKKSTKKQKRVIRKAFNEIQPEFTKELNRKMLDALIYGSKE
jgi:hypothetical protein